jgi:hypothetical protein
MANQGNRQFSGGGANAVRRSTGYRGPTANQGRNFANTNRNLGRSDFNRNFTRANSPFIGNRSAFGNSARWNGNWNNWGWGNRWGYGHAYPGFFGYGPFGYGLGGLGYGIGGYGLGWGLFGWPYYGYGWGGSTYYPNNAYSSTVYNDYSYDNANVTADQPAQPQEGDFAAQGEANFRAGNYDAAVKDFRHALIEEPQNAALALLMSQALFATGQYNAAAGATETAMGMLPEDKWDVVVANYRDLYGDIGDYTSQLKSLERARDEKPNAPELRFLLGFHYGYLGYPEQAVRELNKAVDLENRDPAARRLHDIFAAKTGASTVGPPPEPKKEDLAPPPRPDRDKDAKSG